MKLLVKLLVTSGILLGGLAISQTAFGALSALPGKTCTITGTAKSEVINGTAKALSLIHI